MFGINLFSKRQTVKVNPVANRRDEISEYLTYWRNEYVERAFAAKTNEAYMINTDKIFRINIMIELVAEMSDGEVSEFDKFMTRLYVQRGNSYGEKVEPILIS